MQLGATRNSQMQPGASRSIQMHAGPARTQMQSGTTRSSRMHPGTPWSSQMQPRSNKHIPKTTTSLRMLRIQFTLVFFYKYQKAKTPGFCVLPGVLPICIFYFLSHQTRPNTSLGPCPKSGSCAISSNAAFRVA